MDDLFTGVVSALTAENTLNATDVLDGGAGNDTLKAELKSNFNGFATTGKLANVETVELTNTGTIGRTFDATGVSGVTKYVLNAADSNISLSSLAAAGVGVDIVGLKSGTTTIGYTTKAVEGTSDALALGLNAAGSAEVKDASGAVTAAAKYVTVTASGIEALTVAATGTNLVNLAGAATKSIVASGAGSLDIEAVGTITSFDASASKGAVKANLTGAADGTLATVKGGEADDTITVSLTDLTANATVSGGAGTNTLKVSGNGTLQPAMTQFQTLELNGVDNTTIISGKNISDLATVNIKSTAANAGINGKDITLAGLNSSALTVGVTGPQNGTVTLTSPTVLTYGTTASTATTTAKGTDTISTAITAGEAINATVNVGAYTTQTGDISVNKATAVTLNVASGLSADTTPVQKTSFDANLSANAAQNLSIKADGILGVTAGKTITAGAATLVDVTAASGGDMALDTVKAQHVNITAGATFDIQDSTLTAAEQVVIAANAGHTNGTGVALGKIAALTLSGSGTATGKQSQATLGDLGSATDITNAIAVTASGLKGGATIGTIDTKGGNVSVTATDVTGNLVVGAIGGGANKVGNVTINAATLGSTEVGAISTVAGAAVQVSASGLLGKNGSDEALKMGAVLVAVDSSNKNTGSATLTVSGSNKLNIGAIQAKTVTVDASGYLGGNIAGAGQNGTLGKITGQTVTVKGAELGTNAITIDAQQNAAETAATVVVTGGVKADTLTLDSSAAFASTDAVAITFTGGEGADKITFSSQDFDLTGASSSLTLSSVETLEVATGGKTVTLKAANISGATLALTTKGTLKLVGTDSADTIDLTNINGAQTLTAGKGNDTIKLSTANDAIDTLVFQATATNNGNDTITGFLAGATKDALDFQGFLGAASNATLVTTAGTVANKDVAITVASDITFGYTAAQLLAALNTGGAIAAWDANNDAAADKVIFVTPNDAGTSAKLYYATASGGSTEFATVELVGTISYTGTLHTDNFV